MERFLKLFPGLWPVLATALLLNAAPDPPKIFLEQHCYRCHGPKKQKGKRRLDTLEFPISTQLGAIQVQDIIDQLNLGEMPPEDELQPSVEERAAIVEELTIRLQTAREKLRAQHGQTQLRRLNRREYTNTLQELFQLDLRTFDPTRNFPRDNLAGNLDNIGDTLVTSGYLLDQYIEAADTVVEKALGMTEKPEEKSWHFKGNFDQGQELSYSHKNVYNFRYLCVYEVPNTVNHEGGYAAISEFKEGVHADGDYEIRILAHAMHRDTPYDPSIFDMDFEEPFRLGVVPGDHSVGLLHHPQPIEPQLAETVIQDGDPQWYSLHIRLEKGQTPRFIFPNGMANCRQAFSRIASQYKSQWPEGDPYDKPSIVQARRIVLQHGKMPHIRIHEVNIRGPIYEGWPPAIHKQILGERGFREENITQILQNFASQAFRRPATELEIEQLLQVVQSRRASGHSPLRATLDAIKAALCSPAFLYLSEIQHINSEKKDHLSPHDLASRLSYFLWSTMPDPNLRELADNGKILDKSVLASELDRLLDDPKATNFHTDFTDAWLNLRALGDMPPDRTAFRSYYSKNLQSAMKRETQLFFAHLIQEDRPASDIIDSDYTFANKPLAQLYKFKEEIPPAKAHQFRKVNFKNPNRGGLLGMGSVLTISANGIETSPVTRGVWLLQNFLGTPPPQPPDNVPPIDPDVRGTASIRDQLRKHRELPTCYNCHAKIDPPGFALENFDPIGQWRTNYPAPKKGKPIKIDPSGTTSDGEEFANIVQFKKLLASKDDLVVRHLATKLLSYATGRQIEALDRPELDELLAQSAQNGHHVRQLLHFIVQSEIFRNP
jgi:hypothetical protein